MGHLDLVHLEKAFGATRVVEDFTLSIAEGEFISLLGPSGCGKTTILRMVAGFESPSAGAIRLAGADISGLRPRERNIGMVFQSYALFPNLTVRQNIGFGLEVAGLPKPEIAPCVDEMLALIGLDALGGRYPFQLSGGQQQRVALARALAPRPRVLLLDEPLSALDAQIRVSLRTEMRAIQRELGITTLFVTHDQEEALSISDRVVVMNKGRAEQTDVPFAIYNRPATSFVANFVGALNTLEAVIENATGGHVRIADLTVPLGRQLQGQKGDSIRLAIRPESFRHGAGAGGDIVLPAVLEDVHFLGSVIRIRARVAGQLISVDSFNRPDQPPPPVGATTALRLSASDILVLEAS
jgi:putative spermidine/putrescine transport system ATP-binding protein